MVAVNTLDSFFDRDCVLLCDVTRCETIWWGTLHEWMRYAFCVFSMLDMKHVHVYVFIEKLLSSVVDQRLKLQCCSCNPPCPPFLYPFPSLSLPKRTIPPRSVFFANTASTSQHADYSAFLRIRR